MQHLGTSSLPQRPRNRSQPCPAATFYLPATPVASTCVRQLLPLTPTTVLCPGVGGVIIDWDGGWMPHPATRAFSTWQCPLRLGALQTRAGPRLHIPRMEHLAAELQHLRIATRTFTHRDTKPPCLQAHRPRLAQVRATHQVHQGCEALTERPWCDQLPTHRTTTAIEWPGWEPPVSLNSPQSSSTSTALAHGCRSHVTVNAFPAHSPSRSDSWKSWMASTERPYTAVHDDAL